MTVRLRALAGAALLAVLASCTGTTYDDTLASTTSVAATTSTVPTGTAAELVDRMVAEVAALGPAIVAQDGDRAIVERVEALWRAAEPQVRADLPDLVDEFEASLRLVRESSEENRAADAEKAFRNLSALADVLNG